MFLAVLLFFGIYYFERPYRLAREQKPDPRIFPSVRLEAVTNIVIRPAGQSEIRVEKTNNTWHITRPFDYPGDTLRIEVFLAALTNIVSQGHISSSELNTRTNASQEFGFETPAYSIAVQQPGLQRPFLIGAKTVVGDQMFLQVVGGEGVHLVDASLLKLLPQRGDDWRETTLLPIDAFNADALEARVGTKTFRFELSSTNYLWRMTKPIDARADSSRLESLLAKLAESTVVGFIPEGSAIDLDKIGLPVTTGQNADFELTFYRGTNVISGLQVGNSPTNFPQFVFARRSKQSVVFLAPKSAVEPLRTPSDFRDRHLIIFPASTASKFEIEGEDKFELQRESTNVWFVTKPERFPADTDLMHDLLLVLDRMEIEFVNDVVTDFAPFGLESPFLDYKITGTLTKTSKATEPITEQLTFGTNDAPRINVRRNQESRVYSINPQEFELLPRSSWQMRDRSIFKFDAADVVSVTIQQRGKTRKIIHQGTNEWALAEGSQGIINPFSLEEAVHRLGELKAIFWTAKNDEDRSHYGFEKADHTVSFEVKRNDTIENFNLEFGDYSPFYHPYAAVRIDGKRMVFEFPLPLFMEFVRRDLSIFPPPLPVQK